MITNEFDYADLGADYYQRHQDRRTATTRLVAKLTQLGYRVTLDRRHNRCDVTEPIFDSAPATGNWVKADPLPRGVRADRAVSSRSFDG